MSVLILIKQFLSFIIGYNPDQFYLFILIRPIQIMFLSNPWTKTFSGQGEGQNKNIRKQRAENLLFSRKIYVVFYRKI